MPSGVLFFWHADRETLDLSVYPWTGKTDVRRCSHGARKGTPMQELRFVAVSEDGSYAVLAVPGRSGRFILSIDERLRAVAQGQTSRLAQYEIEVESPLRPKEIQARIRAGETAEEIADAAGIPVERVRWFEGPVLAERAYIADQAQAGPVRPGGGPPGARPPPRARPHRSVIPHRSGGADRSLVDRPVPPSAPAPGRPAVSARSAVADRFAAPERPSTSPPPPPVPPRPAQQDRPAYRDYVEFPESAPYRIPTPAEEPPAHRGPAQEPADHRAPDVEQSPAYRAPDAGHRGYADPAPLSAASPAAA